MESHKHAADGTSDPSPGLCTLPLTPLVSQASPAWVPHPSVFFISGRLWGAERKPRINVHWELGWQIQKYTEILHFFFGISFFTEEGNTRNLISQPLWAIFFYTQYSYISYFSPDLWVLIETVQPPGPLGVHLSLTSVDLQNTQILFTEQALLSQFSSDAAPFPN